MIGDGTNGVGAAFGCSEGVVAGIGVGLVTITTRAGVGVATGFGDGTATTGVGAGCPIITTRGLVGVGDGADVWAITDEERRVTVTRKLKEISDFI